MLVKRLSKGFARWEAIVATIGLIVLFVGFALAYMNISKASSEVESRKDATEVFSKQYGVEILGDESASTLIPIKVNTSERMILKKNEDTYDCNVTLKERSYLVACSREGKGSILYPVQNFAPPAKQV